jgi:uncharacterized protein (DUF1684 family)
MTCTRSRTLLAGVTLVAWTAALVAAPARPVSLPPEAAKAVLAEIAKDRADTQAWLKSDPQSYLAAIDRKDFERRTTLTVGRASDNDIRIDDPSVLPHHVRTTVEGDRFHVVAVDAAAHFTAGGVEERDLRVGPSSIGVGRFLIRLSHQRYPGLIVFDPKSAGFARYKGLSYFPPDLAYRFEAALIPNPNTEIATIMSTRGNLRRAQRIGWFELRVGSGTVRLECLRLLEPGVDEDSLEIFFRDSTAGTETYPLGRYLDVKKLPSGLYLVDFNFAYNPACAYSDHYNCPVPPKANTIDVPIRAGERDSHYH